MLKNIKAQTGQFFPPKHKRILIENEQRAQMNNISKRKYN